MIHTHGRRPLACHHEAGHAVARWWLGFHVDAAVVLSVEEVQAGVTVPDSRGREHRCEGLVSGYDIHMPMAREMLNGTWEGDVDLAAFARQAESRAEMALVELYAGGYAEAQFTRRSAFACFLSGGGGDVDQARRIASGWFDTEEGQRAAHVRAEAVARALVRSPKGWSAIQTTASALLDRGRIEGVEVDARCSAAYGEPFAYISARTAVPAQDPADTHTRLGHVIGPDAIRRPEAMTKLWDYIRAHGLQAEVDRRVTLSDANLRTAFGLERVSMHDLSRLVKARLSPGWDDPSIAEPEREVVKFGTPGRSTKTRRSTKVSP